MSIANPVQGSIGWFARHELNLSWRDFMRMMTAGKPKRNKTVLVGGAVSVLLVHVLIYYVLKPALGTKIQPDTTTLTLVTGTLLLTLSLMTSQAMELVTRAFYSRSDLDLILSSPVSVKRLFTVRIGAIAVSTSMLSLLLCGAAINILAIFDSPWWLAAYPVIAAFGMLATAVSLAITVTLFDTIGARATRLVAQILAAIVGAGFIIGIQLAAISSIGSISRFEFLTSTDVIDSMPAQDSFLWIPARAAMGEPASLGSLLAFCCGAFLIAIAAYSANFGQRVIAASGISQTKSKAGKSVVAFKKKTQAAAMRHKEWKLLIRDHWLISQSLMQVLYLIPPAFMLWQGFGEAGMLGVVGVPVLVMAAGQLAGGLAWLAISGEDAPQLVETAPVANGAIIRAKIEAVLGAIVFITVPIIAMIAWMDPRLAVIAGSGIAVASVSSTMIQLWFRSQAKRSSFRRRQTSSRVATIAEALSSITWAGSCALIAGGMYVFAACFVVVALIVLWTARSFRPAGEN